MQCLLGVRVYIAKIMYVFDLVTPASNCAVFVIVSVMIVVVIAPSPIVVVSFCCNLVGGG